MGRPGIMLYFDILEPIRILTNTERGKLLTAILEYGKEGKEPDFRGKLALAWGIVVPKLDCDGERYDNVVAKRKYAGFCSSLAKKNLEPISFDEWLQMGEMQRRQIQKGTDFTKQESAYVDACQPTTAATTTASTATSTSTATTTNTNTKTNTLSNTSFSSATEAWKDAAVTPEAEAAAKRKEIKMLYEKLGRGDAAMTEAQLDSILDKIGPDRFGHYLARLNRYSACTGQTVKSDYVMMLRWWTEDSTAESA